MGDLHVYCVLLALRVRSQRVYGPSFAIDVLGSVLFGLIEFAEVWIVFHNVTSLGGMTFAQVCLLFGISHTGYAASQVLFGHVDRVPLYLRTGTFEAFYLRPLGLLGQLITSEVALRRLGWLIVGLGALGYAVVVNDLPATPRTAALLMLGVSGSAAIFGGIFVWAAALQFFLIDGDEATNAFSYGGRYASQQPASIFPTPLLVAFAVAVPVAFTGYLPALALLELPAPANAPWLDPMLAWATPLVAAWVWLVAFALWRWGTRHYQGGGG